MFAIPGLPLLPTTLLGSYALPGWYLTALVLGSIALALWRFARQRRAD